MKRPRTTELGGSDAHAHAERNNARIRLAEDDDQVVDLPDPRPLLRPHGAPKLVREHDCDPNLSLL